MLEFVPSQPGRQPKYDWQALHEPGYFFVPCATKKEAARIRNSISTSFRSQSISSFLSITTSAGQFRDATGTLQFGVMVKRK